MMLGMGFTEQPDGRWRWHVSHGMQEKEHGFEPSQLAAQAAGQLALDRLKASLKAQKAQ